MMVALRESLPEETFAPLRMTLTDPDCVGQPLVAMPVYAGESATKQGVLDFVRLNASLRSG